MTDTALILLSWAVHLSNYSMPTDPPDIQFKPHEFFIENACNGRECNAVGWYNDEGIIYIDVKYRDINKGFASALVVHELVHYLQHKAGNVGEGCEIKMEREREAYAVQDRYTIEVLTSIPRYEPRNMGCGMGSVT